jgi:hypothetical protein
MRDNLVIVRAGDRSLHPHWLKGAGERNWDLVVNYFGDDPERWREADVRRIDGKGPKWPALHDLLSAHPDLARGYRHVWLPDDDLMADKASINRLFDICAAHHLEVAQPALSWDSYISHAITLRTAGNTLRYTNFVEIMAPCISADMLARALPLFGENQSGWGLDLAWRTLAERPERGIAIIDAVTVRHTRSVGGPNYKAMAANGISPYQELRARWQKISGNALGDPDVTTYAVLTRNGRLLSARRRWRYAVRMAVGSLPALRSAPHPKALARELATQFWMTLAGRPVTIPIKE